MFVLCAGLGALLLLASCGDDSPELSDTEIADRDSIISYLSRNNLLDSTSEFGAGIFYQVLGTSNGESIGSGDVLSIYYTASVLDGGVFDSHQASNGDAKMLKYNTNAVFPLGLDEVLSVMKVGDSTLFYLPSSKAFAGVEGLSVPSNSIISILIKLESKTSESELLIEQQAAIEQMIVDNNLNDTIVHPVDTFSVLTEGIYRKRTVAGDSIFPSSGDTVSITYSAYKLVNYPNGSAFQQVNEPYTFVIGSSSIFSGLDAVVGQMEFGERIVAAFTSSNAYSGSAFVLPTDGFEVLIEEKVIPAYVSRVQPYEALVFEVQLSQYNTAQ